MNSNFLNGFADELTKEGAASHPLLTSVTKGGTLLGRKVKGMMNRVMKGKNPRMKKTSGASRTQYGGKGPGWDMTADAKMYDATKMEADAAQNAWKSGGNGQGVLKGGTNKHLGKVTGKIKMNPKLDRSAVNGPLKAMTGSRGLPPKAPKHDWGTPPSPASQIGHGAKDLAVGSAKSLSPKYGPGKGLPFSGRQAPEFTENDDKGKIGNPTENPGNFKKKAAGTKTMARALELVRSGKLSASRLSKTEKRMFKRFTSGRGGSGTTGSQIAELGIESSKQLAKQRGKSW